MAHTAATTGARSAADSRLSDQALAVLQALPYEWLIVNSGFGVLFRSTDADRFGIANSTRITDQRLRRHVTGAMRQQQVAVMDLDLPLDPGGKATAIRIRCCPVDPEHCAILLEDMSALLRVDAMKRDFIVNVSHELKTPVGALMLLTEAISSAKDDPESLARFVGRIQSEVERLGRLVTDVTELSRVQADEGELRFAHIPAQRLIGEVLEAVRPTAVRRHIQFNVAPCENVVVYGDEERLATALLNLVTNAINYSPEHTNVTIVAKETEAAAEILVSDQGVGISEVDQGRIFERFYRVDPARSRERGGTGLGLSIVKHICAQHYGECAVWSRPGEGSTFTLRLPHRIASSGPRLEGNAE